MNSRERNESGERDEIGERVMIGERVESRERVRTKGEWDYMQIKQGRTDPKCLLGALICGEIREHAISNILFRLEGWPWTPILTPLNLFVCNEIYMVGSSICFMYSV